MTNPAAAGVRVAWQGLPGPVRHAIEEICGSPVIEAWTQPGGFSPGVAARVLCADGTRHFVKAVSADANPISPQMHRQEGKVLAALDPVIAARQLPVPRLRGMVDREPWVALVADEVVGRPPAMPWKTAELVRVIAALDRLSEALTPAPISVPALGESLAAEFTGWRTLASSDQRDQLDRWSRTRLDDLVALEETWAAHCGGDTLLHCDIRADNLLLTADRVFVVDWPGACRGAAFVELLFFAPSVAMQGGPELTELLSLSRAAQNADKQAVAATLCAFAGFLTCRSLRPAPPGLPTLRPFQAAQADIARRWLADLI